MHDSGDVKMAREAEEKRVRDMADNRAGQKRTYEKVKKHSTAPPEFRLGPAPIEPPKKKPKGY